VRYVIIGNENRPPMGRSPEGGGGGRELARRGPAPTPGTTATHQGHTTHAGGISLAAVLGGTLLRWGSRSHDTSPRPVTFRH
jgi:hypothetical protein